MGVPWLTKYTHEMNIIPSILNTWVRWYEIRERDKCTPMPPKLSHKKSLFLLNTLYTPQIDYILLSMQHSISSHVLYFNALLNIYTSNACFPIVVFYTYSCNSLHDFKIPIHLNETNLWSMICMCSLFSKRNCIWTSKFKCWAVIGCCNKFAPKVGAFV